MNIPKLVYSLSFCNKLNTDFTKNIIKRYEKSRTVATRHGFRLNIFLKENQNEEIFRINYFDYDFLDSSEPTLGVVLQNHNNNILGSIIPSIYDRLIEQNINLTVNQLISVLTIASCIKYYSGSYRYIYIPVIIDYGRNGNQHQTAIIIDLSGTIIFYEPYGKYSKYDKNYSKCICEFLSIFNGIGLFNRDSIDNNIITTYHDLYKLYNGIQNIILTRNNSNMAFAQEFKLLIDKFILEFPKYTNAYDILLNQDKVDKTYQIVEFISYVRGLNLQHLYKTNESKMNALKDINNNILLLYGKYNSKSCVSITLIEMNFFFNLAQSGIYKPDQINYELTKLYNTFEIANPNDILVNKLVELTSFLNTDKVKNAFNYINDMKNSCSILYS